MLYFNKQLDKQEIPKWEFKMLNEILCVKQSFQVN